MKRTAVLAALVLASVFAGSSPAVAGGPQSAAVAPENPDFASVHFTITVHADGSAEWTFQYRTPLTNESQRENFRSFASEFENQTLPLYDQFRDRARSLVAQGENVTNRSMRATNFTRSASITGLNNNLGIVEMRFTWTNFAEVSGDRVVVGDLFEGGLYIGPDQRLIIRAGPDLRFVSVTPDPNAKSGETIPTSDTVTWFGAYEFTDERPHAVLTTATLATSTATGVTQTTVETTTNAATGDQAGGFPWFVVAAFLVLGAAVGGGVLWWRRDHTPDATDTGSAAASATESGSAPEPAVSDEEMISDEDRVRRLLEDHGGRMRQVQIVDQTDWSKSKVSMLLSDMEDDGEISRMRIGRENVVSLPGHEPDVSRNDDENDE